MNALMKGLIMKNPKFIENYFHNCRIHPGAFIGKPFVVNRISIGIKNEFKLKFIDY